MITYKRKYCLLSKRRLPFILKVWYVLSITVTNTSFLTWCPSAKTAGTPVCRAFNIFSFISSQCNASTQRTLRNIIFLWPHHSVKKRRQMFLYKWCIHKHRERLCKRSNYFWLNQNAGFLHATLINLLSICFSALIETLTELSLLWLMIKWHMLIFDAICSSLLNWKYRWYKHILCNLR